jgi:CIC family chloride channel protein
MCLRKFLRSWEWPPFFTGVVWAPVTGIILIIEMTAGFTMFLLMLGACFAAMLVPL